MPSEEENIIKKLEKKLNLKQMQIQRLLNITQAINSNVKAPGLYDMYRSFLSWEMEVKNIVLYIRPKNTWDVATHIGINEDLMLGVDVSDVIAEIEKPKRISYPTHNLLKHFDVAIPVIHNRDPIAIAFIGGMPDDDFYNNVTLITHVTSLIAVAIENKRLFKKQQEQEIFQREMTLARDMQKLLVPDTTALPKTKAYELDSIYMPHYEVGGDYYDCIEFDDWVSFCVADISGKGLAAAIMMASFQANLHTLLDRCDGMEDFVRNLNQSVLRVTKGDKYVTFFFAEYNTKKRLLRYINAGHIPPVLISGDQVIPLDKGCTILGMFPELPFLEIGEVPIEEESIILTFTDGITDIRNDEGSFFNEDLLYDFAKNHQQLPAAELNRTIMNYIETFRGSQYFPDDITLLTCKIFKPT